jgi:hypothetical protein
LLCQRPSEIAWAAGDIYQSLSSGQMQSRCRAMLLGAVGDAAGDVESGRTPQPVVHGCDERAVHRTLSNRGNLRTGRFTRRIEETVPQRGGLVEETTGQLDRILAHFAGFRCAARDGEG